ncbi:organic cation transporter protein-like isoform X1 [Ciona intestinalis]
MEPNLIVYLVIKYRKYTCMHCITVMEICGYKWRAIFGLTYQCFYSIGYMSLSGVAYNWRDWHETMFVCTILSLPFLLFAMIIPESPRWLFTKEKDGPATKTTLRMAKFNGVRLTEEDWQRANVTDEKIQLSENSNERKYSSIDLFKRPGIRLTTVKIMFNWFVNSFVFYGISLNAGALAGDIFVNNTLNGVMGMGSNIFCMLVMDKIGRRLLLTLMLLLAGCGLLASAIINEFKGDDQGLETLGLVFAFAAKCGISGSFSVIYNFTAELYPTVVRSNGIGMGSLSARIGGIVAPFVISLQDYVSWLPNVIFGSLGVIAGLSALTFQETNGDTMMETLEEAEVFYKTGKLPKAKSLDKGDKSGFNTDLSRDLKDMNIFTKL